MAMDTKRTILFVDDAEMFRQLGALFLARSGRVHTACNGMEALAIAHEKRPDVIVSDLWMPVMAGDALCRAVRGDAELHDTPVILMTSGENAEERALAVRAGADDVLSKPLHRLILIEAVNRFARSAPVRGLTRVTLETPVQIRGERFRDRGRLLNLSRGGLFVASERIAPVASELSLRFQLPDEPHPFSSTAEVVWTRLGDDAPQGMGMRFLALDRTSARQIEDFVHERAPLHPGEPALADAVAG